MEVDFQKLYERLTGLCTADPAERAGQSLAVGLVTKRKPLRRAYGGLLFRSSPQGNLRTGLATFGVEFSASLTPPVGNANNGEIPGVMPKEALSFALKIRREGEAEVLVASGFLIEHVRLRLPVVCRMDRARRAIKPFPRGATERQVCLKMGRPSWRSTGPL